MPRVYKYWCEPATPEDDRLLCAQIRMSADYRRDLAQIENRGRTMLRSIWAATPKEKARELAKDKATNDRIREVLEEHPALRVDRATRMSLITALGVDASMVAIVVDRDTALAAQYAAARAARETAAAKGLSWGTYQHVAEAFAASSRTTQFFDDVTTHAPYSTGVVAVHLQPARPLVSEGDKWIQIGPIVRHGSEIDRSGRVRPARHNEVKIRVGTLPDRTPRWAVLHVLMHRDIPKGSVVSWAMAKRRMVGPRWRWEFLVTFDPPVSSSAPELLNRSAKIHSVGVDIGWRHIDDHMRIAYWWGTDGRSGEVSIPDRVISADAKADSLRAIRDRATNEIRSKIKTWVSTLIGLECERWIIEETSAIHAWLKRWRFVRLISQWQANRVPGDGAILAECEAWLKQDRHLWAWEAAIRERRQRQVNEIIRVAVVRLCRDYGRVGLEEPFVAKLKKKAARCEKCAELAKRCDDCRTSERLRRLTSQRVNHAAPSRIRAEFKTFGPKYGATILEFNPAYTTIDCAECGARRDDVEDWSPLHITCSTCQVTDDQDRTAAKNFATMARAAMLDEDGKPLASPNRAPPRQKLGPRSTRKSAR